MELENDPRLTAYALGELGTEERLIFEEELTNAGGAETALDAIQRWAALIREAYAAEPVYAMSDQQRAQLLAGAGSLPVPIEIEEVQHSDKVLPWVTQPVISEVDKQRIAEALKPTPWRRWAPVLGSVGVAAGVVWLAALALMHPSENGEGVASSKAPLSDEPGGLESVVIQIATPPPAGERAFLASSSRPEGAPPFRYGEPLLPPDPQLALTGDLFNPLYLGYRRSEIPFAEDSHNFEALRQYLADGRFPPEAAVRVEQLLNEFDFQYEEPTTGETFVVETEVADCPWDPERQLVQVGVRARDDDQPGAVAEAVSMAVEFNPDTVAGYRRIGQEDEAPSAAATAEPELATVLPGQNVTALYEVMRKRKENAQAGDPADSGEVATVRVDYRDAEGAADSVEATVANANTAKTWRDASDGFRFAASVAGFGLLLGAADGDRPTTYDLILDLARNAVGEDPNGERGEFVELVEDTRELERAWQQSDIEREDFRFASPPRRAPKVNERKR
jgi:hypothetical protein